jgi:hypothetical protein
MSVTQPRLRTPLSIPTTHVLSSSPIQLAFPRSHAFAVNIRMYVLTWNWSRAIHTLPQPCNPPNTQAHVSPLSYRLQRVWALRSGARCCRPKII